MKSRDDQTAGDSSADVEQTLPDDDRTGAFPDTGEDPT